MMERRHTDDDLDTVAVLALGALPVAQAEAIVAHMATCESCRALYAELRPVADLVGYAQEATSLDEVTSARMKSRIMRAVGAGDVRTRSEGPVAQRAPKFGWLAAAAAAILAVAIGADDLAVRDRAQRGRSQDTAAANVARQRLADERAQERASESRLAALLGPGGKHFDVPQGEVVTSAGRIYLALKLAALPRGKTYQAWTLSKGAKAVAPSSLFSPTSDGVAFVELPADAAGVVAVAISVEPAGGSHAPTSTPKFIRKLT